MHVVLLSGRSGSGKSTVAYEITHQLSQREFPHVHIEADNLDAIYPKEKDSELMLANLRALWSSYYSLRGCRTLLISGTGMVLQHASIREVIEGVCSEPVSIDLVVLEANDQTIESLLRQREIGTDLDQHIQSSLRMSKILHDFGHSSNVHRVCTDDREVKQTAEDVISTLFDT